MGVRSRHLKVFTLGLSLFVITVTTLLLNYTHSYITDTLNPETYFFKFSDQIKRLVKYSTRPCSCATCISKLKLSPWFDERFNETVPPLLTEENSMIPEDVYKWWMTLQRESKPRSLNETMKELFDTISGNDFRDTDPSRCRRCAVVGNSGNLKNSQYGEAIDDHDVIMRMNHAPTSGFEDDVGRRTTHHFIYPESASNLHENATVILIPFKTRDLEWIVSALTTGTINFTYTRVPSKIKANREKILIYNPSFIKYVLDTWMEKHGRYPSTGILSIIFSLHVCDKVDVYGFGANSKGNWHHYWENNSGNAAFRKTGVHDADFQANVTETLSSISKIHIFKGR